MLTAKQTYRHVNCNQLRTKTNSMTKLESLFNKIELEKKRIKLINSTKGIDEDFRLAEVKKAKSEIVKLQELFNKEYEYQNN